MRSVLACAVGGFVLIWVTLLLQTRADAAHRPIEVVEAYRRFAAEARARVETLEAAVEQQANVIREAPCLAEAERQ